MADERLAALRQAWERAQAMGFASEAVYSHEGFGYLLAALADAETRAARDAARLAAADTLATEIASWAREPFRGIGDEERYEGVISACEDRIIDAWHAYEALADAARPGVVGEG